MVTIHQSSICEEIIMVLWMTAFFASHKYHIFFIGPVDHYGLISCDLLWLGDILPPTKPNFLQGLLLGVMGDIILDSTSMWCVTPLDSFYTNERFWSLVNIWLKQKALSQNYLTFPLNLFIFHIKSTNAWSTLLSCACWIAFHIKYLLILPFLLASLWDEIWDDSGFVSTRALHRP